MNDDWRVQVTCPTTTTAANLAELLREGGFEHGMGSGAGDRVVVSVDGHELFLYASTRGQAEKATDAVKKLAAPSGISVETQLRRWHPVAEEWEDPESPLPTDATAVHGEHEELIEEEREETQAHHAASYEVRVETQSHRDTVELARQLKDDGIPSLRRWRYLLIGAADEDAANALAERVRGLAPAGSTVQTEATLAEIEWETPANPFAVFGGLGG
jgi:hypothetical protein